MQVAKLTVKNFISYSAAIFLLFIFSSCASFSNKVLKNSNQVNQDSLDNFVGSFAIFPHTSYGKNGEQQKLSNKSLVTLQKFLFSKGLPIDSTKVYYVNFKPIDKSRLSFTFKNGHHKIDSIIIAGKLKKGMFYLENKIFGCHGIPYLLGGCEQKKIRLGITKDDELIVHETFDSSGAFLLFFWAGSSYNQAYVYSRISND